MFNILSGNNNGIKNVFGGIFSSVGIIAIVIFAIFIAMIIFVGIVFSKNAKGAKKPYIYKCNGHELQVFVKMTRVEIFYDGKIIDEMAISMGRTAGATFNETLDGIHYKINIGYSGITPSVSVFANNEKLMPIN